MIVFDLQWLHNVFDRLVDFTIMRLMALKGAKLDKIIGNCTDKRFKAYYG